MQQVTKIQDLTYHMEGLREREDKQGEVYAPLYSKLPISQLWQTIHSQWIFYDVFFHYAQRQRGYLHMQKRSAVMEEINHLSQIDPTQVPEGSPFLLDIDFFAINQASTSLLAIYYLQWWQPSEPTNLSRPMKLEPQQAHAKWRHGGRSSGWYNAGVALPTTSSQVPCPSTTPPHTTAYKFRSAGPGGGCRRPVAPRRHRGTN